MRFMSIIPKTSHHTNLNVCFQEHNSVYPLLWVTTRNSCSKGVTPFARTAPSWKRAFPGRPGMPTIELMVQNQIHIIPSQGLHNLKYIVFAFDRNLHLLATNSL